MIIDYDRNPSLTEDQKLQSLIENLMLAFGETMDILNKQQKQMDATDKKIDKLLEAIGVVAEDIVDIRSDITTIQGNVSTIQGNITTINGKITALEAVAADAILQSTAS